MTVSVAGLGMSVFLFGSLLSFAFKVTLQLPAVIRILMNSFVVNFSHPPNDISRTYRIRYADFRQYGVVFFVTSILSGTFSLVFLAATLGVGGPRRGQGRVWPASFERQSAADTLADSTRASQSLTLSPQATDAEADAAASWLRSNADPGTA